MHKTFDSTVPVSEQRQRLVKSHTGRKHRKTKGPGKKAESLSKKAKNVNKLKQKKIRKFREAVAAFFRGERDTHPKYVK